MADDLIVPETLRADVVFAPGGVDAILERLERDVRATPVDISTKAGRAACSSLAHRVARSKTALDELGKNLVADRKARAATVDADRRRLRKQLDDLRDEVRKPLTEWEDAEKRRVEGHEVELMRLGGYGNWLKSEPTAEEIALRITQLNDVINTPREWHEFAKRAADMTANVRASLVASHEAAVRREAERAELVRLRAEAAAHEQRERDERLQREAAEKAKLAAEAEAREAARMQAAKEAAERAKVDRERLAAEEARRVAVEAAERAEQVRFAAEKKATADAEAAAERAERDRTAAIEAERARVAEERRVLDAEAARREADERHRENIDREIAADLVRRGFTAKQAGAVVAVLATGDVPHVRVVY